jgi:ectoine hydroxylase-related dioxygenase (phytanoyl-CoA dioxygenase family)
MLARGAPFKNTSTSTHFVTAKSTGTSSEAGEGTSGNQKTRVIAKGVGVAARHGINSANCLSNPALSEGNLRMNQTSGHREALLQLLEETRLTESEVSERLAQAQDPAYWKSLNPSLSINSECLGDRIETNLPGPEAQADLQEEFGRKGYFQIDSVLSEANAERLKTGMEIVKDAGWHPVFSFVYDQFWLPVRTPLLESVLSAILGAGYKQSCYLWAHYVCPLRGAHGWPPHVDYAGRRNRVNVWLALSDATLDNGCMYLIPKDLTPPGIAENFLKIASFSFADVKTLLQGGRALPVRTGAALGWGPEVIHWGSYHKGQHGNPRFSISMEFVGASERQKDDEPPLLDTTKSLPTFEQRLYSIAQGILVYQKAETLLIRYLDLAQRLLAKTESAVRKGKDHP